MSAASKPSRAPEPKNRQPADLTADRRAYLMAAILILGILVCAYFLLDPAEPAAWSYQVLMLTLLLAAIVGRALLGYCPPKPLPDLGAWRTPLIWPLLFLAAILPFLGSLTVGFVSDDFGLAWAARQARSPLAAMSSQALLAFYRPLTLLLWWLGDRLWHGAPYGYHALALLLHGLNSLLVYALGFRLLGSRYGSLAAALLFAVHPLHVEPVTWPAASSDVLCVTSGLLSLLLLECYLGAASGRLSRYLLPGALAAFMLALLTKEAALPLPGVVILRLALDTQAQKRRSLWRVGAAYSAVLALYLAFRFRVLGGVGGYEMPLTVWNTIFPSAPLLMIADFSFPLNRTLFLELASPWIWRGTVVLMAAVVLWWLTGLDRVPARRLWLWIGFVFLMAAPTWLVRSQLSVTLESSRFSYFPTIGLFLLAGDLCAGRGADWRQSSGLAAAIIAATILTVWYITPWHQAGRMASDAVDAGQALIEQLTTTEGEPSLYVSDLPEAYHGAPILANCYPQALNMACGHPLPVRVISARPRSGAVHPEVMAASVLGPREFAASYSPHSRKFTLLRSGAATGPTAKRTDP